MAWGTWRNGSGGEGVRHRDIGRYRCASVGVFEPVDYQRVCFGPRLSTSANICWHRADNHGLEHGLEISRDMPRITHRLTAIKVASLKAKGLHADGNGLYLRVTAGGTKSWMFRFTRDGAVHDMGLGPLATVPLALARELAAEARRQRRDGVDPIEARKAMCARKSLAEARSATFRACAEQLIASREMGWRNAKHGQQRRRSANWKAASAMATHERRSSARTLPPCRSGTPRCRRCCTSFLRDRPQRPTKAP